MPSPEDIVQLLLDARSDRPQALEGLLGRFRNYLLLLAHLWLDRSLAAKADASDAVQETLLRAVQKFSQFRGTTEPELAAWLRQILARVVVNLARHYRAEARQLDRELRLGDLVQSSQAIDGLIAASGTSPSQAAQRRELTVVLADAMAEMSPDHRMVLILRSLQERDWEEVAARMGRSVPAVRMLWTRALKNLRPRLENQR